MKIIRARTAGFCMGVSLALRKLDREVTESNAPIATLGPIIHNPQVMAHYEGRGVRCLRDTAQVAGRGGILLLFGEADHPEVRGLLSYAGEGAMVFGSLDELKGLPLRDGVAYFLAAQTTQDRAAFEDVVAWLRQRLVDIARRVEAMVVVGGFDSGNTRRLADVARAQGVFTVHVETVDQLPVDELQKKSVIGLTAGASTPKSLIDAVQRFLESL